MAYSNRDHIDLSRPRVKEFRVKRVDRFIVTEWEDYRGGRVRELGEFKTAALATEVAIAFGDANPGSLVNGMDDPGDAGYGVPTAA